MSWLGMSNFWLLQWFFVRVCITVDVEELSRGHRVALAYGIMFPVVPLTGWWSVYVPFQSPTFQLCRMKRPK